MSGHEKRSAWVRPRRESLEPDTSWMDEARCAEEMRHDPDVVNWFFPERGGKTEGIEKARAICNGWDDGSVPPCPVRAECLEYALANVEKYGVWGGMSERERRRLRVQRAEERLRGTPKA